MSDQGELLPIKHEPLYPPRTDVYAEGIFLHHWQVVAASRGTHIHDEAETMFDAIFWYTPRESKQRMATVVATFVSWLGCNCGRCFLELAAKKSEGQYRYDKERTYIGVWAAENMRNPGTNSTIRYVESILAEDQTRDKWTGGILKRPVLSVYDLEAIDTFVVWLANERGQEFLKDVNEEIKITSEAVFKQRDMQHRAYMTALKLHPIKD